MLEISPFRWGPIKTNTYLVCDGDECIIIDPASDKQDDIERLNKEIGNRRLKAIILTHNHFDHLMGACLFDVTCLIHRLDLDSMDVSRHLAKRVADYDIVSPKRIDHLPGTITVGSHPLSVIHTPGHSPGSVCLYDAEDKILFSGDTLFKGTCGRTDLPGSDHELIRDSLRRLMELPDDVVVYPGHGKSTTMAEEKDWMRDFLA
ncbi:MAG: MBL fold metallo-hydrolase [Nanoarchaeota archaeon]